MLIESRKGVQIEEMGENNNYETKNDGDWLSLRAQLTSKERTAGIQ